MAVLEKLKELGWYISPEGLKILSGSENNCDIKSIARKALDVDLREIGAGCFPENINDGKLENISGKMVVQVQKVRNVSAPKANEESRGAPRMLKFTLSDGQLTCQAVEFEHIQSLSLNTPPGTKVLLKGGIIPMMHGLLLLRPHHLDVLGGQVTALVEKWELNRSLAKHSRNWAGEEGAAPPWIPFGQKILRSNPQDRNFKSLEIGNKENKENPEFEAQRKDAIAEAAKAGCKKVFGGGNKQMLDHNVQQIVDMGFTISQAEYALRQNKNNVDRALRSLQRRSEEAQRGGRQDGGKSGGNREDGGGREERSNVREDRGGRRHARRGGEREEEGLAKPSGNLSLFDFLEDKLPIQNEKEIEKKGGSGERKNRNNDRVGESTGKWNKGNEGGRGGGGGGGGGRTNSHSAAVNSSSQQQSSSNNHWGGEWSGTNSQSQSRFQGNHPAHREGGGSGGRSDSSAHNRVNSRVGSSGSAIGGGHQSQQHQQKPPRFQNQQRAQQQNFQQHHGYQQNYQQHHHQSGSVNNNHSYQTWPGEQGSGVGAVHTFVAGNFHVSDQNYGNQNSNSQYHQPLQEMQNRSSENNVSRMVGRAGERDRWKDGPGGNSVLSDGDRGVGRNARAPVCNSQSQQPAPFTSGMGHFFDNTSTPPPDGFRGGRVGSGEVKMAGDPSSVALGIPSGVYRPLPGAGFGPVTSSGTHANEDPFGPDSKVWQWKMGDKCMAKYWEDNTYYNAEVTGVSERTVVVQFTEYGNYEEVLQEDCIPFSEDEFGPAIQSSSAFINSVGVLTPSSYTPNHYSGMLEFQKRELGGGIEAGDVGLRQSKVWGGRENNASGHVDGMNAGNVVVGNREAVGNGRRGVGRLPPRQMYVPPAQRK